MSDASNAAPPPVASDGMADEEIAAHTDRWRAQLDESPVVVSAAKAAELLEAVRAEEALR